MPAKESSRTLSDRRASQRSHRLRVGFVLALGVSLLFTESALGQETIIADRPGIGSGSSVLSSGLIQVEGGGQFADSDAGDQYTLGQLLLRLGFSILEVQANFGSFVAERSSATDRNGFIDPSVGVKVPLLPPSGSSVSVSALLNTTIPIGSSTFGNPEWVPSATLLAVCAATSSNTVTGNVGYGFGPGAAEEVLSVILTPSLAPEAWKGVGAFLGYAGFFAPTEDLHFAEAGLTYSPNANWQFDVNGGVETGSGDFFFGFGLATRGAER